MMKKLLSLVMLVLLVAVNVSASFKVGNLYYSKISQTAVAVTIENGTNTATTHYSNLSGVVTIPSSITYDGITYQVEAINNYAFYKSPNITKYVLPNTIKQIGMYSFNKNTSLTEIALPNSVTIIGSGCFTGCSNLKDLTLSNSMDAIPPSAFSNCSNLRMVAIPESVTIIDNQAFKNCTSLSSVWIYGETLATLGYQAFQGCSVLSSINFPNSLQLIGAEAMDGTPWLNDKADGLVYIGSVAYEYKGEMPEGTDITFNAGTKGIAGRCFQNCTGLKSVSFPNTLTTIAALSFEGCTGLKSVAMPNSVVNFWNAFKGCTGLTSVTLPNAISEIYNEAFSGCTSLKSITIPNSVTSIGSAAFFGCSSLTSLPISNSVKTIGSRAYANCTGLTSVTLPNSVTTLSDGVFEGCTGLKSLTIPSSITSLNQNLTTFVDGCTNLKTLNIDSELLASISRFSGVQEIVETVNLGNSIYTIPENAFKDCTALKKVTLPNDFISLGNSAFAGCTQLENVYCPRPRPIPIDASVFTGVQQHDNCKLHVPSGCKELYEAMNVWKEFYVIIEDAGSGGSSSGVYGDVNGDSIVDVTDVNIVINVVLGKE